MQVALICRALHRSLRQIFWAIVLLNVCNYLLADDALPKGSLIGRIVDPDGKAVAAAKIYVNTWNKKILAEAVTDSEGRFRLGPVEPVYRHKFPIIIDAKGFAQQYIQDQSYSVYPGIDFDLGDIQVDRGRIFSGQVLSEDGKPLPDADVNCGSTVLERGYGGFTIGLKEHLKLDSEGRFQTPPMPVGELNVTAVAPGRQLKGIYLHRVKPSGHETLEPIRLEKDVPVHGTVKDEHGKPIFGAKIHANAEFTTTSDLEGRFTINGFGPNPHFQFQLSKEGYVFINWGVKIKEDGIHWHDVHEDNPSEHGPMKEFVIILKHEAWIEGTAVDADTGEPVQLDKVVLCYFERKANGEIELSGCRSWGFEQPQVGQFRISYTSPDEYHLTLSAKGYLDAEAFTPKATELKNISGIEVKMKKKSEDAKPTVAQQRVSGAVTRNGRPVKAGWVGLWLIICNDTAINGNILHGRTVIGSRFFIQSAYIRDGKYSLEVPYQNDEWFVVVEEPEGEITQIGPVKIELNEKKTLDIACPAGGSVSGRVKNVPPGWEGRLWVVAFNKTAIRKDVRVGHDGKFRITQLPPGEFGLKVGQDAFQDSEIYRGQDDKEFKEAYERKIDPMKRAIVVNIQSGREIEGVELELPKE